LHWFESIANENDFQQKIDFLKKCEENDKKIIWNVHNKKPHEIQNTENVENIMKLLAQLSYRIIIHSHITIDVIKDICESDKDILSKIIFVPHPHYAEAYGDLIATNSLQNNKLKILFFGQIRPYKNIELLIKVFNDLNFNDMELNICGICANKEYEQNLLNLIGCNKNVKTNFCAIADSEIPELFANNHILALPYSIESSLNSGTVILAFSYARTVISPNIGTIDEISDKSLFFSYDYKSEQEHEQKLKEQIIAIREKYHGKYNELLNLGERCREYILENNSYLKTAEQLKQVF
jgi:glycosyltransferase involved in cell wall biosynthesis